MIGKDFTRSCTSWTDAPGPQISGAGRLAHEPSGRPKRCMPHGVLDGYSDSSNIRLCRYLRQRQSRRPQPHHHRPLTSNNPASPPSVARIPHQTTFPQDRLIAGITRTSDLPRIASDAYLRWRETRMLARSGLCRGLGIARVSGSHRSPRAVTFLGVPIAPHT